METLQTLGGNFKETRSDSDFEEIYARYLPAIKRYVSEMIKPVRNEKVTNDIVAEIFAKVALNISKYDPAWKFESWVNEIARMEINIFLNSKKEY